MALVYKKVPSSPIVSKRAPMSRGMIGDGQASSPYISRPSSSDPGGIMHKLISGTEITVSNAVTTIDQDIALPAALQGLVGDRVIVSLTLIFAGLRGVMPTGFTAAELLKTLASSVIVTAYQGNKIEHEISGLALAYTEEHGGGLQAIFEPPPGAFTSLSFNVGAAVIPPGAANPNEYFFTPQLLTSWAHVPGLKG